MNKRIRNSITDAVSRRVSWIRDGDHYDIACSVLLDNGFTPEDGNLYGEESGIRGKRFRFPSGSPLYRVKVAEVSFADFLGAFTDLQFKPINPIQ